MQEYQNMYLFLFGITLLSPTLAAHIGYDETIKEAKERFYQKRFEEADRLALDARTMVPTDPESYELRTTIILFRLKQLATIYEDRHGDAKTAEEFRACPVCAELLRQFEHDSTQGIRLARQIRLERSDDERAMFLLARMQLNRLWLNLEVLDKMKGWGEYREARGLIESVLDRNPQNVRALTASAWINYVVGSRNFFVRALLGGGSKKKALKKIREAASCIECDFYNKTEARFALLELLKLEESAEASALAKELRAQFPPNGTSSNAFAIAQNTGHECVPKEMSRSKK